jgi:hypothetical protein
MVLIAVLLMPAQLHRRCLLDAGLELAASSVEALLKLLAGVQAENMKASSVMQRSVIQALMLPGEGRTNARCRINHCSLTSLLAQPTHRAARALTAYSRLHPFPRQLKAWTFMLSVSITARNRSATCKCLKQTRVCKDWKMFWLKVPCMISTT